MLEQIAPGLWRGKIEHEDGEWLVGDNLPAGHPGLLARDDPRGLMVKFWKASRDAKSQKYVGKGHAPELPAHGGRLEAVQVLSGMFGLAVEDATLWLLPGSGVELPPDTPRRWFLPEGSDGACGTTICRFSDQVPARFGTGGSYEYHTITKSFACFAGPQNVPCAKQLVMVFEGALPFTAGDEEHALAPRQYLFVAGRHAPSISWNLKEPTLTAAAVYY